MTCQCSTESTTNTGVNPYSSSIIQLISGFTPGDTIKSVKIGIHSCSAKTFRIGIYSKVSTNECGSRLSYVETDETTITTPELASFSITDFDVPTGETELYVVITTSPTGVWQIQNESTFGTINSGYDTAVTYSTISSQTSGFTFNFENQEILRTCLCTDTAPPPSSGGVLLAPPPIELVKF